MVIAALVLLAASAGDGSIRIDYPFSLISGGIASEAEFEEARRGPMGDQYAAFGFVRPSWVTADQLRWASYFRNGTIEWASVMVRKGELIFTDKYGNVFRGRCGNQLVTSLPKNAKTFVPPPGLEYPSVVWYPPATLPPAEAGLIPWPFPPMSPPPVEEEPLPPQRIPNELPPVTVGVCDRCAGPNWPPPLPPWWIPNSPGSPAIPVPPVGRATPEPASLTLLVFTVIGFLIARWLLHRR
jgi:hypothetical protein